MSRPLEPIRRDAIRAHAIQALLDLPETIGRYTIRGELGRGGMGVVYHAYDPQLERDVAVKVINPALFKANPTNPRLEERFEREMRAVSPIFHPNIVTILDAGIATIAGERSAYYVMEHVTGESLEDRIRRSGPLPRREALEVALAVSKGLAALHERGLVHQDVKPSNVLLPIGQAPKLSDFGLIHLVSEANLARDGSLIEGSLHGLAPEQISAGFVDERTDLFALGALLIRMWTEHEPFSAPSLERRLARIQSDEPDGVERLPLDVAKLARSLLEKSPCNRPRHAQEVIHRLSNLQSRSWPSLLLWSSRAFVVAGIFAGFCFGVLKWQETRLDEEFMLERAHQRAEITIQLERAETIARPLLSASSLAALPADERRAMADRIDGIANRVSILRTQHQERLATLHQNRRAWPSWLSSTPEERSRRSDSASIIPLDDPDHRFDAQERQNILQQIDLLKREFDIETHVLVTRLGEHVPTSGDIKEQARSAPKSERRLRILLNFEQGSGSIEVSRALEPVLTDSFLGSLLREQILPLVHKDQAEFGLRLAFRIIRASLQETFSSNVDLDWAEREVLVGVARGASNFAGGGAASTRQPEAEGLSGAISPEQRLTLTAGKTPKATWNRFMTWLALETSDVDLSIFTPESRELLRRWPVSRPYWRSLLKSAKETPLETIRAGNRALVYSAIYPELAPTFFRRAQAGWQIDLVAGRAHIVSIAGGRRRWSFRDVDADPLLRFRKDLTVSDGLIRLARHRPE